MRLFLDSSFFFPLLKVEVKEFPKKALSRLLEDDHFKIIRSEIAVFELSAKGSKFVNNGIIDTDDLVNGINTVMYDQRIEVIPLYYSEIQKLEVILRKNHSDFVDCLTLASAIYYSDAFLSLDEDISKKAVDIWRDRISGINRDFQVILWKVFRREYKSE